MNFICRISTMCMKDVCCTGQGKAFMPTCVLFWTLLGWQKPTLANLDNALHSARPAAACTGKAALSQGLWLCHTICGDCLPVSKMGWVCFLHVFIFKAYTNKEIYLLGLTFTFLFHLWSESLSLLEVLQCFTGSGKGYSTWPQHREFVGELNVPYPLSGSGLDHHSAPAHDLHLG